jgi:hypothetical protein
VLASRAIFDRRLTFEDHRATFDRAIGVLGSSWRLPASNQAQRQQQNP